MMTLEFAHGGHGKNDSGAPVSKGSACGRSMSRWLLVLCAALALAACGNSSATVYPGGTVSKLVIRDTTVGTGTRAEPGMVLLVQYTGWLYDANAPDKRGKEFDSTRKRDNAPFRFVLDTGQVIKGWDQGITGMRVGGVRELIIPPDLAYGDKGAGGGIIPPNAPLVFQIKLIDAQRP